MNQNQKEQLSHNMKYYRKKLKLTQENLAERLGYSKQAISNWENEKNVPSDEDIVKMAYIFGVEPNCLFDRIIDQPPLEPNLELIEIKPIPNRFFTYVLFFKNKFYDQWQAWIYDMDYPAMIFSGYSCSIHDNYASFKEDFLKEIDETIELVRDFIDSRFISEEAIAVRDTKTMLEGIETFADNPDLFMNQQSEGANMTESEFRINHSKIIEYYQYIEMRLKVICSALLSDEERTWFDRLNDYESDPLGKLIRKIKKTQRQKNTGLLTTKDFKALKNIREARNYWAHQCFGALEHVTFKNDAVKKQEYANRIITDLAEAEKLDQELSDKVHLLNLSVDS